MQAACSIGLEENKITNFLNMSFQGGYTPSTSRTGLAFTTFLNYGEPSGWTVDATTQGWGASYKSGGGITLASNGIGNSYYIQNNTGSTASVLGRITQPAYQDAYNVPIISPQTLYSVRVEARIPSGNTTGNLVIDLTTFDQTNGFGTTYGSFTVPFSSMSTSLQVFTGTLLTTQFSATVPANLLLRVQATGIANHADLEIIRVEVFPTLEPVLSTQLRGSYVDNPEAFDGVTGNLGVAANNQQPVNGAFEMYDQLYLLKSASMSVTEDTPGSEPSGWDIHEVSNRAGACGINAYDVGEEWAVMACRAGVYVFFGQQPIKVSQEIYQVWDQINWAASSTIWVRNDIQNRRILLGVPMNTPNAWLPNAGSATPTSPNVILILDYKGLNDITELANSPQMHTTMFGTLMSVDMRRKWTIWQIISPYADFITRQDGISQPLFLCNGKSTGKIYQLLQTQLSDDGATINSLYTTYAFVDSAKQQQNPLLGPQRKTYSYLQMEVLGGGNLTVALLENNIIPATPFFIKTLPPIALVANPPDDYERSINASGNRLFVQYSTNAVNAYFDLRKMMLFGQQATLTSRGNAAQ